MTAERHVARIFSAERIDGDALDVVRTLQAEGFIAYFVGGVVRDLLLSQTPKDFDIVTDARPEELKRVFGRRCRIIGRRFQLAHVRAGNALLEVATFRGVPADQETAADESGFVVRANTFGTPEQDAMSRDLTINGLFYDPVAGQIIDFIGGLSDIEAGTIRTVGDAEQRFREDPVRLLRAIRFAAKLELQLHPDIVAAAPITAPLIHSCPVARVMEELFRLFESGHSAKALPYMDELGVLGALLPELQRALAGPEAAAVLAWLEQIDLLVSAHGGVPRPNLFALIAWPIVWPRLLGDEVAPRDWGRVAHELIQDVSVRLTIPIRHRQRLRHVATVLSRLLHPPKRGRASHSQLVSPSLPLALTMVRMRHRLGAAGPGELEEYERWAAQAEPLGVWPAPHEPRVEGAEDSEEAASEDRPRPRSRGPRSRGRRERRGGDDARSGEER